VLTGVYQIVWENWTTRTLLSMHGDKEQKITLYGHTLRIVASWETVMFLPLIDHWTTNGKMSF